MSDPQLLKRGMVDWVYGNVAREERWDEPSLKKNKFGHYTNEQNKPVLVSSFVNVIQERHFRIASRELRSEMSTFEFSGLTSAQNPRYKGSGASKDDRVLAMCLAIRAVRQSPKLFEEFTKNRHQEIPSAVELGLNTSPQAEQRTRDAMPEAMRAYFDEAGGFDVPANPIRGYFSGFA